MNATRPTSKPRTVDAGPWKVTLHPPVLVYEGTRDEHITRPNLCVLDGAIGAIFQTTFDTGATPHDRKDIWVTTDKGESWQLAAKHAEVGSYSLFSKPNGEVAVMPYDSILYGSDKSKMVGPTAKLSWKDGKIQIVPGRTVVEFSEPVRNYFPEVIMDDKGKPLYLEDDIVSPDKPLACLWGTIQQMPDGRWIAPGYACYESQPYARNSPAPEMRRMTRATANLFVSADEGRTWKHYSRIATPQDVPDECIEGPDEVHLFQLKDRWRAILRTSALKGFVAPLYYAESTDLGQTWSKPAVLPNVDMIMDPRGLILPGDLTVLSAGRPKVAIYLAQGSSLDFHKIDFNAHHNEYLPRLRTTGHTDVVALGPRSLLFIYDYIPDSWRWPNSPFTAPDAIYSVRVDIE